MTYAILKHGNRFPQKKATLSSSIGELQHDTKHQEPVPTKTNGAHLLKWLAAFSTCWTAWAPQPRSRQSGQPVHAFDPSFLRWPATPSRSRRSGPPPSDGCPSTCTCTCVQVSRVSPRCRGMSLRCRQDVAGGSRSVTGCCGVSKAGRRLSRRRRGLSCRRRERVATRRAAVAVCRGVSRVSRAIFFCQNRDMYLDTHRRGGSVAARAPSPECSLRQ